MSVVTFEAASPYTGNLETSMCIGLKDSTMIQYAPSCSHRIIGFSLEMHSSSVIHFEIMFCIPVLRMMYPVKVMADTLVKKANAVGKFFFTSKTTSRNLRSVSF